jgi:hypothetical protein
MENTGGKTCRGCGRNLPLDDFPSELRVKSGLGARCKLCKSRACVAWRSTHEDATRKHRDDVARYQRTRAGKESVRSANRKMSATLTDAYVCNQIGISVKNAPAWLVQMERERISILRMAKEIRKTIKEKS